MRQNLAKCLQTTLSYFICRKLSAILTMKDENKEKVFRCLKLLLHVYRLLAATQKI